MRTVKEDLGAQRRGRGSVVAASNANGNTDDAPSSPKKEDSAKSSLEYVDQIMALLKTAFPLLALSMETMVDQIINKLKPTTDEDIYRLIVALLSDGIQQLARDPEDKAGLSQATENNLQKFAGLCFCLLLETMYPNHVKYKAAFERDFIKSKPSLSKLVERFRLWRLVIFLHQGQVGSVA